VYEWLTAEQMSLLGHPGIHPRLSETTRYPLTLAQLQVISGASAGVLRRWTRAGLIPSYRSERGRRYYSTGVARALLLAASHDG
jgi:MerR HTH family regulatory protein